MITIYSPETEITGPLNADGSIKTSSEEQKGASSALLAEIKLLNERFEEAFNTKIALTDIEEET